MVVQRWTKQARHVLPEELSQYKKDNPALLAQTYRHSSLLLKALQFIEMGDSNAESHTVAMKVLDDGIESLTEISKQKDGLCLGHTQEKINIPDSPEDQFDQFPQRAPKKKMSVGAQQTSDRKQAMKSFRNDHDSVANVVVTNTLCRAVPFVIQQQRRRENRLHAVAADSRAIR